MNSREKIISLLSDRGYKLISEFTGLTKSIQIQCPQGHILSVIASTIYKGCSCDRCNVSSEWDILITIFDQFGISFRKNVEIDGNIYPLMYTIDDNELIVCNGNGEGNWKDENGILNSLGKIVVRIDRDTLSSKNLTDFLISTFECSRKLYISNPSLYIEEEEFIKEKMTVTPIDEDFNEQGEYSCLVKTNHTTNVLKKKILVAYCRVSSEMQRFNHSISSQEDEAIRYASKKGFYLHKIYEDIALSGKKTAGRKALALLLSELHEGTKVFFYSISRMSRNVRDVLDIVDKINGARCSFVANDLPEDAAGPSANLYINLMATMAQFERETTSKRVSDVMTSQSVKGELRGKPPFGYKFVGKKKPFVICEEEQTIIEYIRQLRVNNPDFTVTRIAKELENEGIKIRKCKKVYPNRLREIMDQNGIE